MLKRLYIDNFRCFVNFEYKPERKQLLLGANGSGKSSLLDAVRLLKGFFRDEDRGDIEDEFWHGRTRWLDHPNQTFQVDVELEGREYSYHLELNTTQRDLHLPPAVEELNLNGRLIQARRHSDFDSMLRTGASPEAKVFYDWMTEDLHCIGINPYAMEKPVSLPGRLRLASDLSNIGDWYKHQLEDETNSESVAQLSTSLQEVLEGFISMESEKPPFENLDTCKLGGDEGSSRALQHEESASRPLELRVTFDHQGIRVRLWFHELSEGQRCLIALYMILHFLTAKGHTVFIDEPDNFLSLREIQPWLLQAETAADDSKGQLILISHHPEILNLWAQEDGLRFFRTENGPVQTEKFKSEYEGVLQPSELIARGWEND